ncbi:hypothetical protein SLEP1_g60009 [Rubroshorea leprosula]|uniref:Uncharacterized protein n=1 Tax=Rubroshorea leprosula TaxID=152421 RepID=A0AAV5MU00_9ROSI|nr:hypothetical protein SLEP1_g60009 [Rubroshorea leprosula]
MSHARLAAETKAQQQGQRSRGRRARKSGRDPGAGSVQQGRRGAKGKVQELGAECRSRSVQAQQAGYLGQGCMGAGRRARAGLGKKTN